MEQNFWIKSYKEGNFLTDWSVITADAYALDYRIFTDFISFLVDLVETTNQKSTLTSFWTYMQAYQAYHLMSNTKNFVNPSLMWSHGGGALDKLWNVLAGADAKKYLKRLKDKFPLKVISNVYTIIFLGGGHHKEEKAKILSSIAALKKEFEKNVKSNKDYMLFSLEEAEKIAGLGKTSLYRAKERAKKMGQEGYLYYTRPRVVEGLLKFIADKNLRKFVYESFLKTTQDCEHLAKNEAIYNKVLGLKKEYAALHGKSSYAELIFDNYVLTKTQTSNFLQTAFEELDALVFGCKKEIKDLFDKDHGEEEMQVWDYPYYLQKYSSSILSKKNGFSKHFNFEISFPKILAKVSEVFSINFEVLSKSDNRVVYKVTDSKTSKTSIWIVQPYHTKKDSTAYAVLLTGGYKKDVGYQPCVQFINLNLTSRVGMQYHELRNIVHELGHAIHADLIFSVEDYCTSGMGFDLIEMPSQFLEQWCATYEGCLEFSDSNLLLRDFNKVNFNHKFQYLMAMESLLLSYKCFYDLSVEAKLYSNKRLLRRIREVRHSVGSMFQPQFDSSFLSCDPKMDNFAHYIYFFAENIALSLYKSTKSEDYRNLFKTFSGNKSALKEFLSSNVEFKKTDLLSFFN